VNDETSPATIAATAAVPAVTVTGDATISAGTIAATSTVPELAVVGGALEIVPDTIAGTSTVPSPSFTLGQGVTVAPAAVAGTSTADASVTTGQGSTFTLVTVAATSNILLEINTYLVNPRVPAATLDVMPYHVVALNRRWKSRMSSTRPKNVVLLKNGTVTDREPADSSLISKIFTGGHENSVTSTEATILASNNYALEVK